MMTVAVGRRWQRWCLLLLAADGVSNGPARWRCPDVSALSNDDNQNKTPREETERISFPICISMLVAALFSYYFEHTQTLFLCGLLCFALHYLTRTFFCDDITSLNFNFIQYNTLMVITQHFKGSQISTKKGKLNSSFDFSEFPSLLSTFTPIGSFFSHDSSTDRKLLNFLL